MNEQSFTEEQKQYLQGFAVGIELARQSRGLAGLGQSMSLPVLGSGSPGGNGTSITIGGAAASPARRIQLEAQDRFTAAGRQLCNEEKAKRDKDALDMWDEMQARCDRGEFPKGTDVFLTKFHGMFHVAPAQDSYMCRLRLPGGVINSHQMRGVADLAEQFGGGYSHVTTRANLQIREIGAGDAINVLTGLRDLGINNTGAGADNIRNVTASPTAGIDAQELIDTRPLARELHHHILNRRELYGLPRKFNIAFDGGGCVSAVADTNDIAFFAVRVDDANATEAFPAGVYFRMELGGITGHKDFTRDTGVLLRPDQCVAAAVAVVRAFIDHGDRTDRRKARLKYLLDAWGFDKFMAEARKHLPYDWPTLSLDKCLARGPVDRLAHIGVHAQSQPGLKYVGVALLVGKLTCEQMRALADIAQRYGSADIRLTVWQNLLIANVPDDKVECVKRELESMRLQWSVTNVRAGLIACTGNKGCKFAASDTKGHAAAIAEHIESRLELDQPINIHLTGCHHSCAQHYIGDIGLLGASVSVNDDMVEGYHIVVGGGSGDDRTIARELFRDVPATEAPQRVESILRTYIAHRRDTDESFHAFANRHSIEALIEMCDSETLSQVA